MSNEHKPTHDSKGYPTPRRKLARGYRPNPARPLDPARKAKFIAHLAKVGIVGEAAKHASPHSHLGALSSWYREREHDPAFAREWDEALEMAQAAVESELHRRAVEGVDEPVFYMGEECGTIKRYSDTLLLARMRKLDPAYRQQHQIAVSGNVTVKAIGIAELPPHKRELLRALLSEEVKQVPAIVVDTARGADTPVGESTPEESDDEPQSE